eukprot:gnl/Trimastix_PCT/321.p1 GENE.gnl/Trimastix_PCT/321~~gnl/Trimastix_PCT/321.p1  ORF type:complete len:428 (+),score=133.15 gnl/Trimastix_PCT/321:63-1346(+)
MKWILVALVLCGLAFAIQPPYLMDSFMATADVKYPFVPALSGSFFYDYAHLSLRMDLRHHGQHVVEIFNYAKSQKYVVAHQQCRNETLIQEIPPLGTLPHGSTYLYDEPVHGVDCQVWHFDFAWMGVVTWYIEAAAAASDPATLHRCEIRNGDVVTRMDFYNYTAQPIAEYVFDPTQFGCKVPQPPAPKHTVMGIVRDATNNRPIPYAVVYLEGRGYSNMVAADEYGLFQFENVPQGRNYTLRGQSVGFHDAHRLVVVDRDIPPGTVADLYLSPVVQHPSQFRVVLSWGVSPRDLDLKMKTPWGCQVSFWKKTCSSMKGGNATLDFDARHGYGPETITVHDPHHEGEYDIFVRSYKSNMWQVSHAQVAIYANNMVRLVHVQDAHVEAQDGHYWHVGKASTTAMGFHLDIVNKIVRTYADDELDMIKE